MAAQLLDIFGFLSVLLRAFALASNSVMTGGVVFELVILSAVVGDPGCDAVRKSCRRLLRWSACALIVVQSCYVAADSAILAGTTGLGLGELAGANFFLAGASAVCAAGIVLALAARGTGPLPRAVVLPVMATLAAQAMVSHAAARLEHRALLLMVTALHQAAAALWIGSMPYLLLSLSRCGSPKAALAISGRFSRLAIAGVATLGASGAGLSWVYIGSAAALYGTSYGAMVACKAALMGMVLFLGGLNFLILRQDAPLRARLLARLKRFAEAEAGIGFTVILAAASLTSQPPAVDLTVGRVSAGEIAQRMRPGPPRLQTPPLSALSPPTEIGGPVRGTPPSLADIAWSEYNHNWAGLIVLAAGLLALAARTGRAPWARHWPLVFLGLAVFLFLRADAENWPLGPRSFWQSFEVPEVLQHRVFVLLVVAFAWFEWGVRTGRIARGPAELVFPMVCAAGGALLLTHSHSLVNVKEEFLAELSHIALAIFAVAAGWSRWLELRLAGRPARAAGWVWPVCLVLVGAVLVNYREG